MKKTGEQIFVAMYRQYPRYLAAFLSHEGRMPRSEGLREAIREWEWCLTYPMFWPLLTKVLSDGHMAENEVLDRRLRNGARLSGAVLYGY